MRCCHSVAVLKMQECEQHTAVVLHQKCMHLPTVRQRCCLMMFLWWVNWVMKTKCVFKHFTSKAIRASYFDKNWSFCTLQKICRRVDETGSAVMHHAGSGRPKSARTAERITEVNKLICYLLLCLILASNDGMGEVTTDKAATQLHCLVVTMHCNRCHLFHKSHKMSKHICKWLTAARRVKARHQLYQFTAQTKARSLGSRKTNSPSLKTLRKLYWDGSVKPVVVSLQ